MNVINMLRKEWISYRKTMVWAFFYLLLFAISFRAMTGGVQASYVTTVTLAVYMVSVGSIQNDEKNKVDSLLGVLPLKRDDVVRAKFLLSDLFLAAGLMMYCILGGGNRLLFPDVDIFEIPKFSTAAAAFLSTSFLNLVTIPVAYRFGTNRGRILVALLGASVFGGVLAGGIITGMLTDLEFNAMAFPLTETGIGLLMLAAGIVIQGIGFFISLKIYRKKEF